MEKIIFCFYFTCPDYFGNINICFSWLHRLRRGGAHLYCIALFIFIYNNPSSQTSPTFPSPLGRIGGAVFYNFNPCPL
jgi:hypothetical protein